MNVCEYNLLHATKNLNKVEDSDDGGPAKGSSFIKRNAVNDVGSIAPSYIRIPVFL